MRPLLFFTLIFLSAGEAYSQQADSLKNLLNRASSDTARIRLLLSLHESAGDDSTAAKAWLDRVVQLSSGMKPGLWTCRVWLRVAGTHRIQGHSQMATGALDRFRMSCMGQFPELDGSYFLERGILHQYAGRYDSAAHDFLLALRRYETARLPERVATVYNNLANVYWELDKLDDAMGYYQRSLAIYEATGNERESSDVLGNIGLIHRSRGDYDQAKTCYLLALGIDRKYGNLSSASVNLQNLGALYTHTGDYDAAAGSFREAAALSRQVDDPIGVLYADHGIASVRMQQGNYPAAIAGFSAALTLARQLNYREEIKNLYESLSEAYERSGNARQALASRKQYEAWKDSIARDEFASRIKELELTYETERKDQQITLLAREKALEETESRRQAMLKWISLAALCGVTLFAGLLYAFQRQRMHNQQQMALTMQALQQATFRQQATELEMKALRAQINPHFLFNCMNSIQLLILKTENDQAARYLSRFSSLLRQILEHSEVQFVALEQELALLSNYIAMERLRFKGKMEYTIELEPGLAADKVHLPPMVLQPFVENAIWHGLSHKAPGEVGHIRIHVAAAEELIICTIEDNGVGRARSKEMRQGNTPYPQSMGLKITEDRLRLIGNSLSQELIRITDLTDAAGTGVGTRVEIFIPVS